ncbi:MAG: acyl-ACP--UDP-N-acetylglucosamine O-acyltransferase [Sphingobacteriia bacterium]|nr:acyl-ACP--UDP-N-acetylglucosamine O-acyltransferase [Sphingobacteriia bacterium]
MTTKIHPSAVISPKAQIDVDVEIGPFCIVYDNVKIGKGTKLHSHVVVDGHTTIGNDNKIFPFVSLGSIPQDLKYKGEESKLIIGNNNSIREYTTMNPGTEGGGLITKIGDNCLFMMSCHVAHDCTIGNNVIMANNATLAGHVTIEEFAIIGGLAAVHQWVRIGAHAMIGGMSAVEKDVIPYGLIMGERASLAGLNIVGLKRRNFNRDEINALREAYEKLFENKKAAKSFEERVDEIKQEFNSFEGVQHLVTFLKEETSRSFCMPKI